MSRRNKTFDEPGISAHIGKNKDKILIFRSQVSTNRFEDAIGEDF